MSKTLSTARYTNVNQQKSAGATYTPLPLADFVAKQALSVFDVPSAGKVRILDPACGDGVLLGCIINNLPPSIRTRLVVHGFDTNLAAIKIARKKLLSQYPELNLKLEQKDFLNYVLNLEGNGDLFSSNEIVEPFHLVIANPPYVRTQVMGAAQAQHLAQSFNLSGRVDLYYPFILGISRVLDKSGVTSIITSNRFMTTKSGQGIRKEILGRFNLLKIWDLGDTKLFDAAVLPSVLVAKGTQREHTNINEIPFTSIYETKDTPTTSSSDVFQALEQHNEVVTKIPSGQSYKILKGILANENTPEGIWRITTKQTDEWLAKVESNTWDTFNRIGKIRVGVKSTADKIFLRSDWDTLETGRPELLKPLITRKCAQRFKPLVPENPKHRKEILYPHEVTKNGRSAVDLKLYPNSANYLAQHKEKLASRKYLIDAGRNWYELWVPHDPAAWCEPKLVFPDISEKPTFWMDTSGAVVNGECYWLQCKNKDEQDLMWLALAVANSSFIETFYDHRFNNKLYVGKRRFITQYVKQFPLPQPNSAESIEIVRLTKEVYEKTPSIEADKLGVELEKLILAVFGLAPEKVSR